MFWIVWLVGAVGLAIAELHSGDFTLLMLSGGCAAGLVAALVMPDLVWAQVIVAALAAGLLLWMLRPTLLARVRSMPGYRSSVERMVGSSGLATQAVTATGGEVKIDGEVWSARSIDGAVIALGTPVDVYGIDGTFLTVAPHAAEPPSYGIPPSLDGQPAADYWARPQA